MSENEIIEGKKIIAKFMGMTSSFDTFFNQTESCHYETSDLKYDSDWNMLMPVLNKISNEVEISDKYEEAYSSYYHIDSNLIWLPIQEVFENVLCILKWYCK